jgi:nitrite reductase/ring-hydroxylating ferredoxin subunit
MIDVGAVDDFPNRSVTLVRAGSREIGIVHWDDGVYALSNVCTHQRGPLCRGTLGARLTAAAPGELQLDEDTPVLACPWHGWEFDIRTGRALWDERCAVRTYGTRVENGRVLVELKSHSA